MKRALDGSRASHDGTPHDDECAIGENKSPFLKIDLTKYFMQKEATRCISHPDTLGGIVWTYFEVDWTYGSIKATMINLAVNPDHARFYLGVTSSASWRWNYCRGNETFKPHSGHYDVMHVLACDRGMLALEEMLLEDVEATACLMEKCSNAFPYRTGLAKYSSLLFLYLCADVCGRCHHYERRGPTEGS